MTTIFVKPAPGGRVRMPERRSAVMAETGAYVQRNDYYERLLIGGDVVEAEPPKPAPEPAPDKATSPPASTTSPKEK